MYTTYVFSPPGRPYVPVHGQADRFAVRRIFCVGRNYAEHVREMGGDVSRDPPIFFTKPADAIVHDGADVAYPPRTENLHHEVELVVAIGRGGAAIDHAGALAHVWGYAVGNDLTRRDLQNAAKDSGLPWDMSKAFDASAPVGALVSAENANLAADARIWLDVNGTRRQESTLAQMIWSVPEIIATLSTYVRLEPGDLVFTGTPAGVGPLVAGDVVTAGIDGLPGLSHRVVAAGE
jgi:fumarylpyruvate hydrolase